ncbi:GFA family protein [Oceaniglobus indicus]|uniref:GFA family protein n=1 Tax=Oceaniglobus indicus TaxID=2047749 RepID=UPI000C17B246|nr:GFA family protein [Oceaniglobus indicus]
MADSLNGRCLCGAVTIRVASHDARVGVCHCRMCRRWSGAVFAAFTAPASDVTVAGKVALYASSGFAERAFCPICGSHLWMRNTDDPAAEYDLMPGLFDATETWPLRSEIYADRAPAYLALAGDHARTTEADYEADEKSVQGDQT